MCVHVCHACVCVCHCNTSVLSRRYIFRQCFVKMFHLLAREVNVCTCVCVCLCVTITLLCCQDDTSFCEGSECVHQCVCISVCRCNISTL